jgi:hypothetical protein
MVLSGRDWTWADMSATVRAVYRVLGEGGQRVNFIMWFQDSLPQGNVLAHMRVVGATQPPNVRHTVFINNSGPFLETLITSFARANGWPGPAFVASLEEAREYLAELDRQDAENPPE